MEKPKKRLLDLVREAIRRKHYSRRTEEAYIHWIKRYIFFHNPVVSREPAERSDLKRHPRKNKEGRALFI